MAVNKLILNIPGAEANIAAMKSAQTSIESTAQQMKATVAQLLGDGAAIRGSAANAGTDFFMEIDNAVRSSGETVNGFIRVVAQAKDDTISYDQGGFSSVFR